MTQFSHINLSLDYKKRKKSDTIPGWYPGILKPQESEGQKIRESKTLGVSRIATVSGENPKVLTLEKPQVQESLAFAPESKGIKYFHEFHLWAKHGFAPS